MAGIVGLMYMPENCQTYIARCREPVENLIAVVESNRVEPFAAHVDRWVMQANHDVRGIRIGNGLVEPREFFFGQRTPGLIVNATVDAEDQPTVLFCAVAIVKRRFPHCSQHERAIVVIAGDTVHGQVERAEQRPEVLVSTLASILYQVTRANREISQPAAVAVMRKHRR